MSPPFFIRATAWPALAVLLLLIWGCGPTTPSVSEQAEARLELASSHLQENRPRQSLQELQRVQDEAEGLPEYHFLLGMTYLQLEEIEPEEAIQELERTVDLAPQLGMAWNNLGNAYIEAGQPEKAKQALKRALDISTYLTPEYAAYNLSRLYQNQDQLSEAITYAKMALNHNWRYYPAYHLLADVYIQQGKMDKAKEKLGEAVEAFPDDHRLWLRYGQTQLRQGEEEKAAQSFQRVLEIAPDSESAQVARNHMDLLEP